MPDTSVMPQANAKPNMQSGLDAITKPYLAEKQVQLEKLHQIQQSQQASTESTRAELDAVGKPPVIPEYHPIPPKDASTFFGLMMALGALSGRSTMHPMTTAMNNMSAIMKAQHDGNQEMLAAQREEFKTNFDVAIAKSKQMNEQHKAILEKHKYDQKAAAEDLYYWRLENQLDKDVFDKTATAYDHQAKAIANAEKHRDALFPPKGSKGDKSASGKWKPRGWKDAEGHEIYYNDVTGEEKIGSLVGVSEKDTTALNKTRADLMKARAKALAGLTGDKRSAAAAIYDAQLKALSDDKDEKSNVIDFSSLK